jgi:hypothetical protein
MAEKLIIAEYLTKEETDNYNPQDFNSQAQIQLANFIRLTSLYLRKIPNKAFEDFNDLVYDRREELRDQDYINIMECLARLMPLVGRECKCSADSYQVCNLSIDEFLYCRNYSKWSAFMPQIEFIRFSREHPSYNNTEFNGFLKEYCSKPLEIKIGINPNINTSDSFATNYNQVIHYLLELCEADLICGIGKVLLIIMNFKFCLENIPVYVDNPIKKTRLYNTVYARCFILSKQCVSPIKQIIRQILGCQDCPFKTIQRLMSANRDIPGFEEIPKCN